MSTKYKLNGEWVSEEEFCKDSKLHEFIKGVPSTLSSAAWPMKGSMALGIQPSQVKQYREEMAKQGVSVDYIRDHTGIASPVLNSPKHRRDYCKVLGMFDLNGGYGDPQSE